MRRRFNGRERVALFRLAGGLCADCGCELEPGWHADHVHPYSKSGPTDVVNGAALCPPCNTKKGNNIMHASPRKWQVQFWNDFARSLERHYLCVACPGAGKTDASIIAAQSFERVVVIVPSLEIKKQWRKKFADTGRKTHDPTADGWPVNPQATVVVLTYAGAVRFGTELRGWLGKKHPSLLILDEIHHGGEDDTGPSIWASAVSEAAEGANRSLLLTGTPVRTSGDRIPLVRYDQNDEPIADTRYGFREAWSTDPLPIRKVRFHAHDGEVEWFRTDRTHHRALVSTVEDEFAEPHAMRACTSADGRYVGEALAAIDRELKQRRWVRPDAAALIVAFDTTEAKAIHARMTELGLEAPTVVMTDADGSVDTFKNGTGRYLLAVRKVSEGVDIPRLEVLAFFTRVKTELFFHQVVGRVLRLGDAGPTIEAIVHYPQFPRLAEYVRRLEADLTYQVRLPEEDRGTGDGEGATTTFLDGNSLTSQETEVFGPGVGAFDRGYVDRILDDLNWTTEDQAVAFARWLDSQGQLDRITPRRRQQQPPINPDEEMKHLLDTVTAKTASLAGRMCHTNGHDFGTNVVDVNKRLKRLFDFRDPKRRTNDELRATLKYIAEWSDELDG